MNSVFSEPDRKQIFDRIGRLQPGAERQWGKMDPAQMLAHCTAALEMATGDAHRKQKLVGRIFGPFLKKTLLGEKPFMKNAPTDPAFIVSDPRDFAREKARLTALLTRFCDAGLSGAASQVHSFLGRLAGDEWGVMMYKHLDHHLRQFGA